MFNSGKDRRLFLSVPSSIDFKLYFVSPIFQFVAPKGYAGNCLLKYLKLTF